MNERNEKSAFLSFPNLLTYYFNPIPAVGRGLIWPPPPVVFLHNSKSIGLRLLKFSDFAYIPKALHLGLNLGFNTH